MQDNNDNKILNYLNGELGETERLQVEEWMAESPENRRNFDRIQKIYELSIKNSDHFNPDVDKAWGTVSVKAFGTKKSRLNLIYKIAAMVTMVLGLGYLVSNLQLFQDMHEVSTVSGEIIEINLLDGSVIWLNENSTFSYPKKFSDQDRVVSLNGQAFFEITKNPNKPFFINGKITTVEVLGTSFDLINTETYSNVNVVSGRVSFSLVENDEVKVILTRGEQATYKSNILKVNESSNENASAWMTKDFVFKSTPLIEVTEILAKHFHVSFEIDASIENCLITSSFEDKNLDEILMVLNAIANIKNKIEKNTIRLTGSGC